MNVDITRNTMADNNYESAMDKAIEQALVQAGTIVEAQAAENAPEITGRLKGSITFATKKVAPEVGSKANVSDGVSKPARKWTLHVGTNVEYAPYVEYGRRSGKGRKPFLRPALQAHKHDIVSDFGKWVEEYLKRGK